MTPLINRVVDTLSAKNYPAQTVQGVSTQEVLSLISAAKVFVIDEAETDTTVARDLHPAYFATTTGFYLPAPVCWFEYKAYAPAGSQLLPTGLRSGFLATAHETDGIAVIMVSDMPTDPRLMIMPGFMFDKAIERRPIVIEGQPIHLRFSDQLAHYGRASMMSTGVNFFMELVALTNMPVGIIRRDENPPRTFRRRLAKALGTLDFDLAPVTHIALDRPDLAARSAAGVA